jgi:hypothetical protein
MHIEIVRYIKLTESEDELRNGGYNECVPLDQRESHNPPFGFSVDALRIKRLLGHRNT